jgi:hypothetical protein
MDFFMANLPTFSGAALREFVFRLCPEPATGTMHAGWFAGGLRTDLG